MAAQGSHFPFKSLLYTKVGPFMSRVLPVCFVRLYSQILQRMVLILPFFSFYLLGNHTINASSMFISANFSVSNRLRSFPEIITMLQKEKNPTFPISYIYFPDKLEFFFFLFFFLENNSLLPSPNSHHHRGKEQYF